MARPALADQSDADRIAAFLGHACLSYGKDDWPDKWRRAERIRVRHPDVAHANLYTAVVAGELDLVLDILKNDPTAPSRQGGPQSWQPLLYLCYGRLPNPRAAEHSIAIARALLDGGADPNAFFLRDERYRLRFTALAGAIGKGERGQPSHPRAGELARLLLERGARANDGQALYNEMLIGDDDGWLNLLFEHGLRAEHLVNWSSDEGPMRLVDYLLGHAVKHRHARRIACLLDHGADPNVADFYNQKSAYQNAVMAGDLDIAALLLRHGAIRREPEGYDAFVAACMRADAGAARALLSGHPEYLDDADPLIAAAESGRLEVVTLLLDLGFDPNREGKHRKRALHVAMGEGGTRAGRSVIDLLLARGADPRSRCHGSTPAKWAILAGRDELARDLAAISRLPHDAAEAGHVELLTRLLAEDPSAARSGSPGGNTPLHNLPADPAKAAEVIALLLAHGADLEAKNDQGETPAQRAEARGRDDLADLLETTTATG